MDVQASSRQSQGISGTTAAVTPSGHARSGIQAQVQPVMGQGENDVHPLSTDAIVIPVALSFDGEPVIRRRATSGTVPSSTGQHGWQELFLLKQVAKDIRHENVKGVNLSEQALRTLGCDRELIDQLIGRHHASLRAQRALAGGEKPTQAQRAQALALCIVDLNRWMWDREMLAASDDCDASASLATGQRKEALAALVQGAKLLISFDGLLPTIELWARLEMNAHGSERNVMWLTLINHTGLFETNARRLLDAYAEATSAKASSSGTEPELRERMRLGLIRQWLSGPCERESAALKDVSCDDAERYHRMLMQQYVLLCRHFGQPLPPMTELILVDDDD